MSPYPEWVVKQQVEIICEIVEVFNYRASKHYRHPSIPVQPFMLVRDVLDALKAHSSDLQMNMYAILGGIERVANYIVLKPSEHYKPARTRVGGVATAYQREAIQHSSNHQEVRKSMMPCLVAAVLDDTLFGRNRMRNSQFYKAFKLMLARGDIDNSEPETTVSTITLARGAKAISGSELTVLKFVGIKIDRCKDLLRLFVSMLDFQLDYVGSRETIHREEAPEDTCGLVEAHYLRFQPGVLRRMGINLAADLMQLEKEIGNMQMRWVIPPQYLADMTITKQCLEEKRADLENLMTVFTNKGGITNSIVYLSIIWMMKSHNHV